MKHWNPDLKSLSVQMILSFVALVLLTAAAAGLPATWLIRSQLERQAWAQVEQGRLSAQALYGAKQTELQNLATLTAQRPTLRALLGESEPEALAAYLDTLQAGSGLDLVLVCDPAGTVAQAGQTIPGELCAESGYAGFYAVPSEQVSQAWLLAAEPIADESTEELGIVVVGIMLDDEYATQMSAQTGLEHTILVGEQPVAASLSPRPAPLPAVPQGASQHKFDADGHPYYVASFPLDETGLRAEVALDVSGIAATEQSLIWTLAGTILVVALAASLLGTVLARRIGRPLTRLAGAAGAMSQGDLDTPVVVESDVREVALVAQALEGARSDLQRTLAELRQEKAWTDHLLEAIVEGIVTLDRQGRITFFSRGAERITGWQRDEVLGHSCDQIFKPLETDRPFSELIPTPGHRAKIPVRMRDAQEAILAVTGARLSPPEGEAARVALVFRDVSEAEAVHRLLGHFLADVAHEFRTPLSSLAASVELLMDQAPDLSAAELEQLLNSLHLSVLGLQTLIDNLLESASIEAGHFRVRPRPANLSEIMAEAIRTMQPILDRHGQRLVVGLPAALPKVQADPRRTVQVLVNLLSNASKYGPDRVTGASQAGETEGTIGEAEGSISEAEGTISEAEGSIGAEIEMGATVQEDWVRVTVADSGPGVPPQARKDLFRRFAHPEMENGKAQMGAGLGLSVVKAIVEAHGGTVGIDSGRHGGSVFWFTLPKVAEE